MLDITAAHRDIWRAYAARPELANALAWDADPSTLSGGEQGFIQEVILHLSASWSASRHGVLPQIEGLDRDVSQFLARPKPRAVWNEIRRFQNREFRDWIDQLLADAERRHGSTPFGRPHGEQADTAEPD